MSQIKKLNSIEELNRNNDQSTTHPLITILDLTKSKPAKPTKVLFELYGVFLKDSKCSSIKYGRNYYDYQNGTLLFIAPGQLIEIEDVDEKGLHQPSGLVLFFHPDLIRGSHLGNSIKDYSFFSYHIREALHISDLERKLVIDCFEKIKIETERTIDRHSRKLIVNNIELLLNYCVRFYDRQFIIREHENKRILEKFENLLNTYFQSDKISLLGTPTVSYCAVELNYSVKYFGDLIKKETGQSAKDYILNKTIDLAKEMVYNPNHTVNEIAFKLGFKYPQHFSRLFKQKVGMSPVEYRGMN